MKVVIMGTGEIGCLFGALLSKTNEVIMLANSKERMEALRYKGICISENETETTYPVCIELSGTDVGKADVIIVLVKSIYTYETMNTNRHLIGDHTIVLTLQNGAGNDKDIMHFVPSKRVVLGTSKHNLVNMSPVKIQHTTYGVTTLGTVDQEFDSVEIVAALLDECGLKVEISDNIQRIIWSKLLVDMAVDALTAILGTKISYVVENDYAWDFAKRIIYEGVEVAEEDGIYFDRHEALNMLSKFCHEAGEGFSSTYLDRKNQLRTEIDRINGAVVEQAKLYGVYTPYNSMVVDLLRAIEGTYLKEKDKLDNSRLL